MMLLSSRDGDSEDAIGLGGGDAGIRIKIWAEDFGESKRNNIRLFKQYDILTMAIG